MKICPYCSQEFSNEENRCPWCGEDYWLPGKTDDKNLGEEKTDQAPEQGCLQILLMPLIIALFSVSLLIIGGVLINLLVNFESNQIKIAWIGLSLLLGIAVFFFLNSRKKAKDLKRREKERIHKIKRN